MKKAKAKSWFKPIRHSYLPSSWQGLTVYLVYVAYEVLLIINWYHQGHDYGRLLTSVLPLAVGAAALTQFIAARTSC